MKELLYIDLFCGAGGTSTGVERAFVQNKKCARVIACVNHDANAIASHAANHPNAIHYTEDIRTLDLTEMTNLVIMERKANPDSLVVLWASLECTNFSKAKGGQPRNADSRTLAEHLFRYIDTINPEYIYIENVEEFMCWGDIDEQGHPVSKDEGRLYLKWVNNVCKRGYRFDHRLLNSANYGARTSRTRFFGIFAKGKLPIVFPEVTHCKGGSNPDMFSNGLKPWNPVRDVLELDNEGESIFARKKPLVDKTLERIYAGLIKFVAGGKDAFLVKYNSYSQSGKYSAPGIDEPCPTIACQNRLGVAKVQFLSKQFSGEPNSKNQSIDEPSGAITCKDHHAIINAQFLDAHYGNGFHRSIDEPAPTMTCKDRFSLVTSHFLDEQYGNGTPANIDEPAKTVTTNPKHTLISVKPWIMNTNFGNVGSRLEDPAPVITANHKQHYLMNPQFASKGGDINAPCFTLIARMDKMPPYIITTETGSTAILIYENDSPAMQRIKEFMAIYGIVDIKMRMLNVGELKRIMGFDTDYILIGTQTEQKKYIGNAVEVNMSRVLCEALAEKINVNQ